MSPSQRVVVSLIAGFAVFIVMALIGIKPSAPLIAAAIGITALLTQNSRNDKD